MDGMDGAAAIAALVAELISATLEGGGPAFVSVFNGQPDELAGAGRVAIVYAHGAGLEFLTHAQDNYINVIGVIVSAQRDTGTAAATEKAMVNLVKVTIRAMRRLKFYDIRADTLNSGLPDGLGYRSSRILGTMDDSQLKEA